jgi:hypothetical protein
MLELNVASKSESEIKWVEIARGGGGGGGGGGREGRTFNHQCSSACHAKYHDSIRLSTLEQVDSGTIKAANKQKIKAKEKARTQGMKGRINRFERIRRDAAGEERCEL